MPNNTKIVPRKEMSVFAFLYIYIYYTHLWLDIFIFILLWSAKNTYFPILWARYLVIVIIPSIPLRFSIGDTSTLR